MAEIVNLRMVRKAKARADKARKAETNRARYGEAKAHKSARKAELQRAARELDGSKRERD